MNEQNKFNVGKICSYSKLNAQAWAAYEKEMSLVRRRKIADLNNIIGKTIIVSFSKMATLPMGVDKVQGVAKSICSFCGTDVCLIISQARFIGMSKIMGGDEFPTNIDNIDTITVVE